MRAQACSAILAGLMLAAAHGAPVAGTPVKLIIDTDIGGGGCNDVDGNHPLQASQ